MYPRETRLGWIHLWLPKKSGVDCSRKAGGSFICSITVFRNAKFMELSWFMNERCFYHYCSNNHKLVQ